MARMAVSLFSDETTDYSEFSDELLRGCDEDEDDCIDARCFEEVEDQECGETSESEEVSRTMV